MNRKTDKPAMAKKSNSHPGIEMDAKGHPIAMKKRLPEDREKVRRASRTKTAGSKK